MSDFPFDNKINSADVAMSKSVFSSDGAQIGRVEAAFAESLIVLASEGGGDDNENDEQGLTKVKYNIPRSEIERIVADSITLRRQEHEIKEKYTASSVKENWT